MAKLQLFTPEEIAERKKPKRQQKREAKERQIAAYAGSLKGAKPGFGGEIQLDDGDDKRKVRSVLKEAAARTGIQLRFRPIKDQSRIEFSVVEGAAKAGAKGATDKPARGRRKKD